MSQTIKLRWSKSDWQLINDLGLTQKLYLFMAQSAARLMAPYVPMESGILSQNYTINANSKHVEIRYESPYAHYQYYGELMVAPNGSAWAKRGEAKHYTGVPLKYSKQLHPLATDHWDKAMLNAKGEQLIKEVATERAKLSK